VKGIGGSLMGMGGQLILGRDGSVTIWTKLVWAFFLFSFYGFLIFLMIFEVLVKS
jgi:hypothetical protein